MAEPATTGAVAETPAAAPESFSLKAYRAGEAQPASTKPAAEATPHADEAPDQEVEADPELRKAIDELEAPKDNETPAEKRARTLKHKEAARKGFQTRQANKLTRLERENEELRRRITAPAGERREPIADAPRPAPSAETNDPEPTIDSILAKHPNDPDPYARLTRELAAWDRRQEQKAKDTEQQTAQQRERAREAVKRLETHADHGRGLYRDYDAKVTVLGELLKGHPADDVIGDALAGIEDAKVGGELLYRLASKLDDLKDAVRGGQASLLRFIGRVERDIATETVKPTVPATHVPTAPAPHRPVESAASGDRPNPATRGGTKLSLRELREYEKQKGARRS